MSADAVIPGPTFPNKDAMIIPSGLDINNLADWQPLKAGSHR